MKQCPVCFKDYDDSWAACLNDKTPLVINNCVPASNVLMTTTSSVEGKAITQYLGVITGVAVFGLSAVREFMSGFTDFTGGRSGSYENEFSQAQEAAIKILQNKARQLSADAIVGVTIDFEPITSATRLMLMVSIKGTAVKTAV